MMETYAERLEREKMADYLKDEQDRQERKRKQFAEDLIKQERHRTDINKEEEHWVAVNVELRDEDFMRIAQEAHRRDVTINKMVNIILKGGLDNAEYRFEHSNDKQLLKEY